MIDGRQITITKKTRKVKPVKDYLSVQKCFRKLSDDGLVQIQARIDAVDSHLEPLAELAE